MILSEFTLIPIVKQSNDLVIFAIIYDPKRNAWFQVNWEGLKLN